MHGAAARGDEDTAPSAAAAYGAALLQTAFSAGTYLVAKRALAELSPLEVAALRFVGAALVYVLLLSALRAPLVPPRGVRGRAVLLGLIALPLNQGCFLVGLSLSKAAHAAILYALTPAFVLLGERVFLGRPLTAGKVAGIGAAFAGVLLVLFGRGADFTGGTLLGDLVLLVAVIAWAVYTILVRPLARAHGAFATTGWTVLAGALLTLPASLLVLGEPARFAAVSAAAWGGVAYLVVVTSVIAYALWSVALRRLEPVRVSIFTNLQPVLTAVLAWLVLDEVLTATTIAGGALVIAGVTLSQRDGRTPPRGAPLSAATGLTSPGAGHRD